MEYTTCDLALGSLSPRGRESERGGGRGVFPLRSPLPSRERRKPRQRSTHIQSSRFMRHRSQQRGISFAERRVTKHVPRRYQLIVAAPLVTALEAILRGSCRFLPGRRKTKLQGEPAPDDTLVRWFVIYGKIQSVRLS